MIRVLAKLEAVPGALPGLAVNDNEPPIADQVRIAG
jgi:hypothetical protein